MVTSADTRNALAAADYAIDDASAIASPGLVIFRELLEHNLAEMLRIAGDPRRLRPHCKTHKMAAITRRMIELGITRHKCATLAEAEMLCDAGARDVLVAYQLVGPNVQRFVQLMSRFPATRFAVLIDHPAPLEALAAELERIGLTCGVFLDVDSGMGRTGIAAGDEARQLYEMIGSTPAIRPCGLHWYDGHNRQSDVGDRRMAIDAGWEPLTQLRDQLLTDGQPVPAIVAAGTGSFPILSEKGEPGIELSPGTTTLYDAGYFELFPDLDFRPAAGVLTRVVSANRAGMLTLDCGHKSLAPDQPAGRRAYFPAMPDAEEVSHTEEHLVVRTARAGDYQPGDSLIALPRHVCPTVALHRAAAVVSQGSLVDEWPVTARDR
jgi:D-serine deaminase-like pyridoxal phosphate-dependent protein